MFGLETVKNWWQSLAKPAADWPEAGRSSADQTTTLAGKTSSYLNQYAGQALKTFLTLVESLETLAIYNPDLSQAVSNIVALGNNGHTVEIDAQAATVEKALTRLNDTAKRYYDNGAGVDSLINSYLRQIAVFGGLSSEDVIDLPGKRINQVVLVPIGQLRFIGENGRWVPHQQPKVLAGKNGVGLNLLRLHPMTYRYYALQRVAEDSPYCLPPMSAAVEAIIGPQTDMASNLKWIAKKFGIFGLITVAVQRLRQKANELDDEWHKRVQNHIGKVAKALDGNLSNGLVVHTDDQKFVHNNIAVDARGWKDTWNTNEEQVISGLNTHPVFLGRPNASTETYAGIVYYFEQAKVANMQSLVKVRMERTYFLDLLLGGLDVNGVYVSFNKSHSLNAQIEAQTETAKIDNALKKESAGIITLDEAAQELGYDAAADPKKRQEKSQVVKFRWDRNAQRYRHQPDVYTMQQKKKLSEAEIAALTDQFVDKYINVAGAFADDARDLALSRIRTFLQQARVEDFADGADFANQLFDVIKTSYGATWAEPQVEKAIKRVIDETYQYFRLRDTSVFGGEEPPVKMRFGAPDTKAIRWFSKTDNWFFKKYVDNRSDSLKRFLNDEYLAKGAALFGRATPESIDDFRRAAKGQLDNVNDVAVELIARQSVQRVRNWSDVHSLHQAKIEYGIIRAILDARTSPICEYLNGKKIKIGTAAQTIDRLTDLEPGDFADQMFYSAKGKQFAADPVTYVKDRMTDDVLDDDLIAEGRAFPQYHVKCRSRVEAHFDYL